MTEQTQPQAEAVSDNLGALYAALAVAQGAFQPIEKNRSVTIRPREGAPYSFRYADLEQILAKTRPALVSNGLALFQVIDSQANSAMLRCELVHKDGGRLVSEISIPHPHTLKDPKLFGASVSYFRRYMVTAMLGVAADDDLDDDGRELDTQSQQTNTGKPAVTSPQRRAPEAAAEAQAKGKQSQQRAANAPSEGALATAGELAYITKKITGAGMTIAQAREAAGLDAADTLDGLTNAGFVAMKGALA